MQCSREITILRRIDINAIMFKYSCLETIKNVKSCTFFLFRDDEPRERSRSRDRIRKNYIAFFVKSETFCYMLK